MYESLLMLRSEFSIDGDIPLKVQNHNITDKVYLTIITDRVYFYKKAPHYRLTEVQSTVADMTSRPFTRTALLGGLG